MPRFAVVLIVLVLLVFGGIYVLSTLPKAQPTQVIEIDAQQGGNAK